MNFFPHENMLRLCLLKNTLSNPPHSLLGRLVPAKATDMGFQWQSGCDCTPLEFLGTPALPVLIIGPSTVITFLSE